MISGFTIRKSKYEEGHPYVMPPSKPWKGKFFKFTLMDSSLKKEIDKAILEAYQYEGIPIL